MFIKEPENDVLRERLARLENRVLMLEWGDCLDQLPLKTIVKMILEYLELEATAEPRLEKKGEL